MKHVKDAQSSSVFVKDAFDSGFHRWRYNVKNEFIKNDVNNKLTGRFNEIYGGNRIIFCKQHKTAKSSFNFCKNKLPYAGAISSICYTHAQIAIGTNYIFVLPSV